mmetsp:Transcript_13965/g.32568  ORF Transcript_13965/g.32568 Transcript_13965/m.32568 type:complete len:179 (-) Transcript_13965:1610-2146(-)
MGCIACPDIYECDAAETMTLVHAPKSFFCFFFAGDTRRRRRAIRHDKTERAIRKDQKVRAHDEVQQLMRDNSRGAGRGTRCSQKIAIIVSLFLRIHDRAGSSRNCFSAFMEDRDLMYWCTGTHERPGPSCIRFPAFAKDQYHHVFFLPALTRDRDNHAFVYLRSQETAIIMYLVPRIS